jgi:hypothetical protein
MGDGLPIRRTRQSLRLTRSASFALQLAYRRTRPAHGYGIRLGTKQLPLPKSTEKHSAHPYSRPSNHSSDLGFSRIALRLALSSTLIGRAFALLMQLPFPSAHAKTSRAEDIMLSSTVLLPLQRPPSRPAGLYVTSIGSLDRAVPLVFAKHRSPGATGFSMLPPCGSAHPMEI